MRLKGEEYRKRLRAYSKSTLELISWGLTTNEETVIKMHDITTDSELNEEEVRTKLIELLSSFEGDKDI